VVPPAGFRPGPPVTVQQLQEDFPDMVKMNEVCEGSILHNLKKRFANDEIYTNIGDILVSLNPYKWLNYYFTDAQLDKLKRLTDGDDVPPHIWGIASRSYRGLLNRQNQSILISGESGAGKTEATKKCLAYFAKVAGSKSGGMEDKILNANPILEAFGNAKTVRNNNSSRFGKWMVVYFNRRDNQICGSSIINYLLEQSRIVSQNAGERNYHVFYQLIACGGMAAHPSARWTLGSPQDYAYLNKGGTYGADGIDDKEDFAELEQALQTMQFEKSEIDSIFSVTVATLQLGNVDFTENGDDCKTDGTGSSGAALAAVASALGVDAVALSDALTVKVLLAGRNRTRVPLNIEKSMIVRDSLAKWLYNRMFNWLVHRISASMVPTMSTSQLGYIGVLDIFGFEIFEHNTFEQLCINFCNEKLQANFNINVFQREQELYAKEGIRAKRLEWVSNQHVIDLIEKKPKGIFPLLDNQWKMGSRGSDETFLANCEKHLADRKAFVGFGPKNPKLKRGQFGVVHYAGQVMYQSKGFLDKNSDAMTLNLEEMVTQASNPFVADLSRWSANVPNTANETSAKGGGGGAGKKLSKSSGAGKKKSVSGQFRQQLVQLMETIEETNPSYVRCIKPNSVKRPGVFESKLTLEQLRYAGVFQAVEIRQTGYPFRMTHRNFIQRFRCLFPSLSVSGPGGTPQQFIRDSTKAVGLLARQYPPEPSRSAGIPPFAFEMEVGGTRVFYRAPTHRKIERSRRIELGKSALKIERTYRGLSSRKLVAKMRAAKRELTACMQKGMTSDESVIGRFTACLEESAALRVEIPGIPPARERLAALMSQKACRDDLKTALCIDPLENESQLQKLIVRGEQLGMLNMVGSGPRQDATLVQAQAALNSVVDRRRAKDMIRRGCADYDSVLLDNAEELGLPWESTPTPFFSAQELVNVVEARAQIEREVAQLSLLVDAVNTDCASSGPRPGARNNIDLYSVDTTQIEKLMQAGNVDAMAPITATGRHTLGVVKFTLPLRRALISVREAPGGNLLDQAWDAVERLLRDEIYSGRLKVPAEVGAEIKAVQAEIEARQFRRTIEASIISNLSNGALTMDMVRSGDAKEFWTSEINGSANLGDSRADPEVPSLTGEMSWIKLERLVSECAEDERLNGPITSQSLRDVIDAAKMLGGLRRLVSETLFNGQGGGGRPRPNYEDIMRGTRFPAWFPYSLDDGNASEGAAKLSLPQLHGLRSRLRALLKMGDSDASGLTQLAIPAFETELHVAALFLDCLDAMASVFFCFSEQNMTGTTEQIDHSSYNVTGLAAAQAIIKRLCAGKAAPDGLAHLGKMASLVCSLRMALHDYDVAAVRNITLELREFGAAPDGRLFAFIKTEVEYANAFCDRNENGLELKRALRADAAVRDGDYLDVSTCEIESLTRAIATAKVSSDMRHDLLMPALIEGAETVVSIRRLLMNETGNYVSGVVGPDWKTLSDISKRFKNGELNVPDVCQDEMENISRTALTLEAVEKLRGIVHKSDIRATMEAVRSLEEMCSRDERTLRFVEWGHTVVAQMRLLETSCEDILSVFSEEATSADTRRTTYKFKPGVSRAVVRAVAESCSSYKYYSSLSRRVLQLDTSLTQLDKAASKASESLEFSDILWVCNCARKTATMYGCELEPFLDGPFRLCAKDVGVCFELEGMSVHDRLRLNMDRALASRNSERVVSAMFKFKEEFFHRFGTLFDLRMFECLKEPKRFARRHGVFDPDLYSNMLQYQSTPLHTSLCTLEERRERIGAVQTFHLVLGYMDGEGEDSVREEKCKQLQNLAVRIYGLRDEIYVQIMKQLTRNPSSASRHRGWELLLSCLAVFPPSDAFENFLDYFLRQNSRPAYVKELYRRIYLGADRTSIHRSGVYRRLSTAGLLWKKNDGIERKSPTSLSSLSSSRLKLHGNRVSGTLAPSMSPIVSRRRKKGIGAVVDATLTLNSSGGRNEVTADLLLGKAKRKPRGRMHLGRHTAEIMGKLKAKSKETYKTTSRAGAQIRQRGAKQSAAQEKAKQIQNVESGYPPSAQGGSSWRSRYERVGNSHSSSARWSQSPSVAADEHSLWLESLASDDSDPASGEDNSLLFQQWKNYQSIDVTSRKVRQDKFPDDVDASALSYGSERSHKKYGDSRTDMERRVKEDKAREYSGLTTRRVIAKSQPKHAHIRNYTSIGGLF
jgi:hypothetical protein